MSDHVTPVPHQSGLSTRQQIGVGFVMLICGFLLGYVVSFIGARSDRAERDALAYSSRLANLRGELGMMSSEVNQNNYGSAAKARPAFSMASARPQTARLTRPPSGNCKRCSRDATKSRPFWPRLTLPSKRSSL